MRLPLMVLAVCLGSSTGCFGGILYLDALPNIDLNDAAGDLRSNIALGESDPTTNFDGSSVTFTTGIDITDISIWSVASVYGQALGQEFSSVTLYFRPADGTWQVLETGSPDTSFDVPGSPNEVGSSNPNMLFTQVSYNPPVTEANSYEDSNSPGTYYPIWQNTFLNLNLYLPSGTYQFAINGVGADPDASTGYGYWYNSFVNGPLSGSYQSNESGTYLRCSYLDLSGPCFVENPATDGTWDKPANLNMEVDGSITPEPWSSALLGMGLCAFGWLSGRRRR